MSVLFRKSAIESLSSPEQLDKTISVTSPMSWIAVIGLVIVISAVAVWSVFGNMPSFVKAGGVIVNGKDTINIYSPYAGKISACSVTLGQTIHAGDKVCSITDGGGTELEVLSTGDGVVTSIAAEAGSEIKKYDAAVRLRPVDADNDVAVAYMPLETGKLLRPGMKAVISPSSMDTRKFGHMEGEVVSVDDYAVSVDEIERVVGSSAGIAGLFGREYPVVPVVIRLRSDSETKSGYYWSYKNGKDIPVTSGTLLDITIITSESAPISRLLPAAEVKQ